MKRKPVVPRSLALRDIDDALALAMLHAYQSDGQVDLQAVTVSRRSTWGARYADVLNTFQSLGFQSGTVKSGNGNRNILKILFFLLRCNNNDIITGLVIGLLAANLRKSRCRNCQK